MRVTRWAALCRSAAALVADRVLRGLLALGVMATGASPGWLRTPGRRWWEGAVPAKDSDRRPPDDADRAERGTLRDPALLRELRSLRGSQDLPRPDEIPGTHADAAPDWHPERRPGNGG